MFEISLGNLLDVARHLVNRLQNQENGSRTKQNGAGCQSDRKGVSAGGHQRVPGRDQKSDSAGSEKNAAKNQSLAQIQHRPGSLPEELLLSFCGKHPLRAKSCSTRARSEP